MTSLALPRFIQSTGNRVSVCHPYQHSDRSAPLRVTGVTLEANVAVNRGRGLWAERSMINSIPPIAVPGPRRTSPHAITVLAVTAGVAISNIYYNQALLGSIRGSFPNDASWIGAVPAATQIGFALGMLLFSPLGDRIDRRHLIMWQAAGVCCALLVAALSKSLAVLIGASFMVGVFATMAQQAGPFAAELAPPAQRGYAVGLVMSGLLIGILLARTAAGFVGEYLGWRMVFGAAIAVMIALALVIYYALPASRPTSTLPYPKLLASLWQLTAELPGLRMAALTGAFLFAAFSVFWSVLALLLAGEPFHFGPREAGLFGIAGVTGALAAPWAGKLADLRGSGTPIRLAIALVALSFVILMISPTSIIGLVLGVIVLDVGLQMMQTPNQTCVFALRPEARSRLNTVYMVCYFTGGAIGSAAGSFAWQRFHWTGVCVAGLVFSMLAAFSHGRNEAEGVLAHHP